MNKIKTILFQGDSITDSGRNREEIAANSAKALGHGYACLCASRLLGAYPERNLQFFNRGNSGNKILDLYARWKFDALSLNPSMVSMLVGVNDSWHESTRRNGVELDRYERVYREIIEWTLSTNSSCQFVLCEPFLLDAATHQYDWEADLHKRAAIVRKLAAEYRAVFVPFQEMFLKACQEAPSSYWAPDGIHPSPAGYARMTDLWLQMTTPLILGDESTFSQV